MPKINYTCFLTNSPLLLGWVWNREIIFSLNIFVNWIKLVRDFLLSMMFISLCLRLICILLITKITQKSNFHEQRISSKCKFSVFVAPYKLTKHNNKSSWICRFLLFPSSSSSNTGKKKTKSKWKVSRFESGFRAFGVVEIVEKLRSTGLDSQWPQKSLIFMEIFRNSTVFELTTRLKKLDHLSREFDTKLATIHIEF